MNTLPTFRQAASIVLLVFTAACGSLETSPTSAITVSDQIVPAIVESPAPAPAPAPPVDEWDQGGEGEGEGEGEVEEDPGDTNPAPDVRFAQAACKPKFSKTSTKDDFFILKVSFPSSCQWFAENKENVGNYWDLTVPNYDLRNREKYPDGYAGRGERKLGVHFIRKIGWASHRRFTLQVCSGSACTASSPKWTYRYSI